jgi:hypothetical protein
VKKKIYLLHPKKIIFRPVILTGVFEHESLAQGNLKNMKKKSKDEIDDELRPEYDLGALLKKGVQGKYVKRYIEGTNLVLLAPDVAKAFQTEEVNEALRLVIQLKKIPGDMNRNAPISK